jgi:acetoin utilization deacetylase AcuC-like enzyme
MVTALAVLAEGRADRIVILDCDQHYGDGTDEILGHLGRPGSIHHFTAGAHFRHRGQGPRFFARLEDELEGLRHGDLVLYQAGADPHIKDPLGGWMSDAELRHRDALVFRGVRRAGVPMVWNLAGGYQRDAAGGIEPVIAIHTRTALEHLRVFDGWVAPGGNGDFPGHSR